MFLTVPQAIAVVVHLDSNAGGGFQALDRIWAPFADPSDLRLSSEILSFDEPGRVLGQILVRVIGHAAVSDDVFV